jgi:Glycosyl hydrolase family 20, domain 2/Glycosyl hydrolase family 20, catalytic domain
MVKALFILTSVLSAAQPPLIFPEPRKMNATGSDLRLTESVPILTPNPAGPADLALARELAAEVSDRYGIALRIERVSTLPKGPFILMGALSNPLVRQYCSAQRLEPPQKAEGYVLRSGAGAVVAAGRDDAGAFYGMQSLRQLIAKQAGQASVRGADVDDWPHLPFRAIRLYLPGHGNIAFFKRFLRDFMALYKFNKVVMEVNASMRLDTHPELNAGWIDFARDLFHTQRYYPAGPRGAYQNSAHQDTADGEILEKDEVAGLVRYAASQHIEVIPEIPTFTHSYFWLTRHKDLAAIPGSEWPDIYDPTKPEIYKIVFDVLDEYIDVMKPKTVHIGHDEMFFPIELCVPCKTRDAPLLWAEDVRKVHDHLAARGVKTAIYGDHLIESVRGAGGTPIKSKTGWAYHMPGALTPEQVNELIPKDILIFNWFWQDARAADGRGEPTTSSSPTGAFNRCTTISCRTSGTTRGAAPGRALWAARLPHGRPPTNTHSARTS